MIGWMAGLILSGVLVVEPAVYRSVVHLCHLLGLNEKLVFSVILVESGFNKNALSSAGAVGLMQVMPKNLDALRAKKESVLENLMAGMIILKRQLRFFSDDMALALAAYNAGKKTVIRYRGIPPYRETRHYVRKVIRAMQMNQYICGGVQR